MSVSELVQLLTGRANADKGRGECGGGLGASVVALGAERHGGPHSTR